MVDSQSTSEDRKSFSFLLIPNRPVHGETDTNSGQDEIKLVQSVQISDIIDVK